MIDWAPHAERLKRAIDRTPVDAPVYSLDDIVRGITNQTMQLWPGLRSTAVTECAEDNNGTRTLHILFAAGELDELLAMLGSAEDFARDIGATFVTVYGRQGWQRVLPRYGFFLRGPFMAKGV